DASREWLARHHQTYQVIGGDWQQRREQAMAAVSLLLEPLAVQ
ncbi:nicotinamide-nucleotide adenylyltransferase, partial [Pseudomonas syringae pv. actinidiae ICMP 19072]